MPLLGAVLLAACGGGTGGTASTPGISGDTIYVGALTPLSDPVAVIGVCHVNNVFKGTPKDCIGCHKDDYVTSPYPGHTTFPTNCLECHTVFAWKPAAPFKHLWPLNGAHSKAACTACHKGNPPVYKGTSTACVSCHKAGYDASPYPGHDVFPTTCADCHSTTAWTPATGGTHPEAAFPIAGGAHAETACAECHDEALSGTYADNVSCIGCHEHAQSRVDAQHADEEFLQPKLFIRPDFELATSNYSPAKVFFIPDLKSGFLETGPLERGNHAALVAAGMRVFGPATT